MCVAGFISCVTPRVLEQKENDSWRPSSHSLLLSRRRRRRRVKGRPALRNLRPPYRVNAVGPPPPRRRWTSAAPAPRSRLALRGVARGNCGLPGCRPSNPSDGPDSGRRSSVSALRRRERVSVGHRTRSAVSGDSRRSGDVFEIFPTNVELVVLLARGQNK